jgi:hypothetical protein
MMAGNLAQAHTEQTIKDRIRQIEEWARANLHSQPRAAILYFVRMVRILDPHMAMNPWDLEREFNKEVRRQALTPFVE